MNHTTVCHITMIYSNSPEDLLNIRVERGTKPRLRITDDKKTALVSVPLDTFVNWPTVKAELNGGYHVVLQRLQQQFKITVQHMHEKKPEFIIYSSSLSHEKDVKIQIKEMNTQIPQIGIAGPNMEVSGNLKANKLTLECTVGTMHIYAKIQTKRISLHSQNIVIASEALISTDKIRVISRKIQLDGRIFPYEGEKPRVLDIDMDSLLLHIGIDGCIGESNDKENSKMIRRTSERQITADCLIFKLSGSLANYGRILAIDEIDIVIGGSLLSLSDGSLDSAGRGYGALKEIRGIGSRRSEYSPSSSSLQSAIDKQDTNAVAQLIEKGVDPNDKLHSKQLTLRQSALMKYKETREKSTLNSARERMTLITALMAVHNWRRGSIQSKAIRSNIVKNCMDCAQLNALELQLKVGGNAAVEADSIWASKWVEMDVIGNIEISGQIKHHTLILSAINVTTTQDAIVSEEIFARITCTSFICDGIWSVGENFVLEVKEISLTKSSYIESEKMEMVSGGKSFVDGSWQIGSCWILIEALLTIGVNAKLFIEESATIGAHGFLCYGFCNITESFDLQLKESAHFFHSSKLECQSLKITAELHCTLGGLWIANSINLYVRYDMITTSTGKAAIFTNANIKTGTFSNDATWQVEKNLTMLSGSIEQSNDGTIFVKESMYLTIFAKSDRNWAGKMIASHLNIRCLKRSQYDGFLKTNEMEIMIPYMDESQFILTGQTDILAGNVTVKGNSSCSSSSQSPHLFPSLIIGGTLNAMAIIAPFAAVEFLPNTLCRLFGIDGRLINPMKEIIPSTSTRSSTINHPFELLISAGWITTGKGTSIISMTNDTKKEGIICAATFYHQGQIRFNSEHIIIMVNTWIHQGRLTNVKNKQNHVKHLTAVVDELFLNKGILACDELEMCGDGILHNENRIFAVDSMDIRLNGFQNDDGLMESKNSMKLLSGSKEWTRLGGSIKARKSFDLCAHKLDLAVKDIQQLSNEKRLSFSALNDLLLSTIIMDKQMAIGCAAQRSVVLNAQVEVERLEILIGGDHVDNCIIRISQSAAVSTNYLVITGSASQLMIVVDGSLQCYRLRIANTLKKVSIVGGGSIECSIISADDSTISFDLFQLISFNEMTCQSIIIKKESLFRVKAIDGETSSISCRNIIIDGTVFVEGKLLLAARKDGELNIKGPIIGSSQQTELSVEGGIIHMNTQIANISFLEIYAKEYLSMTESRFKNIMNVALDCSQLNIKMDFDNCHNVVANCESGQLNGTINGNGSFSVFSDSLHYDMSTEDLDRLHLGCKRSLTLMANISHIKCVELDAKWISSTALIDSCDTVSLTAWSISNGSDIIANNINMTALGVILNNAAIQANFINIVAPFIVSLLQTSRIKGEKIEIHSLSLSTNNEMQITGTNYLWLSFYQSLSHTSITLAESNCWKDTSRMMKDRFNTNNIEVDEMILGLKYLSDLTPVKINIDQNNSLYRDLSAICSKFQKTPISVFSIGELASVLHNGRTIINISNTIEKQEKKNKKTNHGSALYDGLVQFKSAKYGRGRGTSDTDIGYVSRSSSEDLDGNKSRTNSPSEIVNDSLFQKDHFSVIDERLEMLEEEEEEEDNAESINEDIIDDEELSEFEYLEKEIAESCEGFVRTDFIVCKDERIYLARLKEKSNSIQKPRPIPQFPLLRVPSSNDLIMKRVQVKHTLSTLDLRQFGSASSLVSLDFSTIGGEFGSPMKFPSCPFQRSKIPRGSFRSPRPITVD